MIGIIVNKNVFIVGVMIKFVDWIMFSCLLICVSFFFGIIVGRIDWIVGIWKVWVIVWMNNDINISYNGNVLEIVLIIIKIIVNNVIMIFVKINNCFLF